MTYLRKIIHIKATDSPNVALALAEKAAGKEPSNTQVVPGMISWELYQARVATWDPIRVCISINGEFYEGGEILLYPPLWLNAANDRALALKGVQRKATAIGVDVAEGGDDTCWAVVDELGLINLEAYKTPNTADIPKKTIALMREYGVEPEMVMFDRGGGGQQHVDQLNTQGYRVSAVAFGEGVIAEPTRYLKTWETRYDEKYERYAYKNRRAQMYHLLRQRLDPSINEHVFAIPAEYTELRRQLAPMPLWYDEEGRIMLPPKRRKSGVESTVKTIEDIIGCSPDQADALVLANYAMNPDAAGVTLSSLF